MPKKLLKHLMTQRYSISAYCDYANYRLE